MHTVLCERRPKIKNYFGAQKVYRINEKLKRVSGRDREGKDALPRRGFVEYLAAA